MIDRQIKEILKSASKDEVLTVSGWVKTNRQSKEISFVELSDGSSVKGLQIIVDSNCHMPDSLPEQLTTGASLEVCGVVAESPSKGQRIELKAQSIKLIGASPSADYPLQKKRHTFEYLREISHLRSRSNTIAAVTRVRNRISYAIHTFFQEKGFYYIHTPIISGTDAEGAGDMFRVTTLPIDDSEKMQKVTKNGTQTDFKQDFFGQPAFLTVSGQLEVENYAIGMGNTYTFGPAFRAENSNTSRHVAEFWMIEPEMAFCRLECNMQLAEDFLCYLINTVLQDCADDLDFFNSWIDKELLTTLQKAAGNRYQRMSYSEAMLELEKSKVEFEFKPFWGCDLQSEHEKYICEQVCQGPVIVYDYPKDIKAFYMTLNEDKKTVRAMDVLLPRLGEVIGGSEREYRYDILRQRIEECGLPLANYHKYLDLRRYGSAPHSGFGLGLARFVQYVTGMQNIRDVIPFPRVAGRMF